MWKIYIGNVISFFGVLCLAASLCAEDTQKAYRWQLRETSMAAAAAVFFGSWAGLSTLIISLYRNIRVCRGRFNKLDMEVTSALVVVLGLLVNNRGPVGLIPVAATVELTVVNYYGRSLAVVKWGVWVCTVLWTIYSFCILDISGGVGQAAAAAVGLASILHSRRKLAQAA